MAIRTGLLLTALLPAALAAQQVSGVQDTTAADTALPLPAIRVTVLRAPLLLAETPYAVTVEPGRRAGPGLTLAEALGAVPGLQVDNRYNFSQGDRISVRGLGARAQFGVRGMKVLVDGIPATLPDGQTSLSHVDPRRVTGAEVLRGPASSAWGNAAGGVIRLETLLPPSSGSDASATLLAGAHGLVRWSADVGWSNTPEEAPPIPAGGPHRPGATLGVRAAASRLLYDGFRDHAAADKRFASARARWTRGRDHVTVVAHGVAYEADNPGSLSAALLEEDRTQAFAFNVAQGTGEAARQAQVGVTWRHALGDSGAVPPGMAAGAAPDPTGRMPAVGLSAWALTRDLDNPIPPVVIDLSRRAAGVRASVDGPVTLAGRTVSFAAGVDVEGQWDDRLNFENDAGERGALVLDQAERVTSLGPFIEVSAPIAGPVSVLAGLRYDRHRFSADDRLTVPGDPSSDDSGVRVMDQVSPSFGLTARLGGASVYASFASSFETPTTTELVNRPGGGAGFNPTLEPQRTWSGEAGVRARLWTVARLHGAVYRMVIRDALIPFEVPGSPGRTFFRNAGSAVHRGIELDVWISPGAGLAMRAGYALVDARFRDFVTADGDRSGNRVPGVAPHQVRASVSWTGERGAGLTAGGRWTDAVPVDDGATASARGYTVLDLRATAPQLPLAGGSLELFGGIENLLDADYVASVVVNAFGGRYYEPGPGRSAYLGARLRL